MSRYEIINGYYEERKSEMVVDTNGVERYIKDNKIWIYDSERSTKALGAFDIKTNEYDGRVIPQVVVDELKDAYRDEVVEYRAKSQNATTADIKEYLNMAQQKYAFLSAKNSKFAAAWLEKIAEAQRLLAVNDVKDVDAKDVRLAVAPVSAEQLREMGKLAIGQEFAETRNSIRKEYDDWKTDDEWED